MYYKESEVIDYILKNFSYNAETGELTEFQNHYTGRRSLPRSHRHAIDVLNRRLSSSQIIYIWMTGRWTSKTVAHKDGDYSNKKWSNLVILR